jgi:predicted glycoside hydrolase/deacetylase ChbG (UPF0249 family)
MNKKVIFNADDFFFTHGVNRGIIESFKSGVVRSSSVMMNLPGVEESVRFLNSHKDLDIGLHINLTYGPALSLSKNTPGLTDSKGFFSRDIQKIKEIASCNEINREISAQLERALSLNLSFSHMDTHHHIHRADERVLGFMIETARKHKLAIRSVDNKMRNRLKAEGILTPDHFIDAFFGREKINIETLKQEIGSSPEGVIEVMCHPGYVDEELKIKSSYSELREMELLTLTAPELLNLICELDAEISSYNNIFKRP